MVLRISKEGDGLIEMKTRWFGAALALAAAGLFAGLMWPAVRFAVPETDLHWMLPLIRQHSEGRSLPEVLKFLISPAPITFGQPVMKIFLFPAAVWGWPVGALIAISVGIHCLNALLLAAVGRGLGLSAWVSGSAAIVYLSLFAHFHSVLWPPAAQHLVAISSILGILALYFKTEERVKADPPAWRGLFWLTLAAAAVSSLGRSLILLPLLILTHLLAVSRSPEERLSRFDRWLPLFGIFLVYPAVMVALVGDVILNDRIASLPVPPLVKLAGVLGLGIAGLAALRQLLRYRLEEAGKWLVWAGIGAGWVVFALKDHRQLFLPYNGLVPWTALWASFLNPFQSALGTDSTQPYHYLTAQISLFSMGLSAGLGAIFLTYFAAKKKELWLLPVWYGACLVYVLSYYSSSPAQVPSRYFIYLSPVFAWVFCATGWWLLDNGGKRAGWSVSARRWAWGLGLAALCLANLLAIRLELFRGRLANTYLAYEEVRDARTGSEARDESIALGLRKLDGGEEGAAEAFRQGVEERPFLLVYLLGSGRLSDVRWIAGERGLREWIDEVALKHTEWDGSRSEKGARILRQMDLELKDYAVCLLGLSVSERLRGRGDKARQWASQLFFLERDPARLRDWLGADERVRGRRQLSAALEELEEPGRFGNPLSWQKEDYGFGRFMVRLMGGPDIRSGYDRISVVP